MDDRNLMENVILLEKGVCDLFLHGVLESSTGNVHETFRSALNEALCQQSTTYAQMSRKGWYTAEAADQNKVNALRQKFSGKCC